MFSFSKNIDGVLNIYLKSDKNYSYDHEYATDLIKIINISIHSKYLDSLPFDLNILIVHKEEKLVELKQA